MKRSKKSIKRTRGIKRTRSKKKESGVNDKEKRVKAIIESLSSGDWNPEERETGILFDYYDSVVHLETSYGPTARRWYKNLWGDPKVKWDAKADTLKITVPWDYCRSADLIIKHKYRKFDGN